MYIVMNRFHLNPGQAGAFEKRWRERESHLKQVPGFGLFRLLKLDETHYSSYVEWESEQAFQDWTKSESFRKAHSGAAPAREMFAGPNRLECWQVILNEA
ncbi:MAG: antibiotic biosynthesis monooxygenase [Deltaproteobacteria bacterium]|nr:antibiotic biosynthesis monooxygenase [Deltaproteobacteria bacterium]